jgi:2-polyprenyl-3-methyl-5-hydroxy-6-metoxy-1,4-benzoquinol methylase
MDIIQRSACLLTGAEDIEPVYSFKKFPVYLGCVDPSTADDDLFTDMNWGCSKSSGSLQLMDLLDPDVMYKMHHNPGTIGKTWQHHHETFYEFIKKHGFKNVLEIGGASGSLVKHFIEDQEDFTWSIIEPSDQNNIDDARVKFLQGYFEDFEFKEAFNTVVHSHVFEHVYEPLKFLEKINSILSHGDHHYISLPNLKYWLEHGYTNALMFEHTFYVDDNILEYLLNKSGFKIVDKTINPHSIFVYCVKSNDIDMQEPNFKYVKELYLSYVDGLLTDVKQITQSIGSDKFYLFGAHIFSQMLINLGLPESQITNILDNDSKKHNLRLYGTDLIVKSPECLRGVENPVVVLRGGVYTDEIKKSIVDVNPNVVFY